MRPPKPSPFSNIKNDDTLLITYYIQGFEFCALCVISALVPVTTLCGKFSDNAHFVHEETEVQRGNLWKDKQLEGGRARNESHSVLLKELHTLPMSGQLIRTCPGLLLCLRS